MLGKYRISDGKIALIIFFLVGKGIVVREFDRLLGKNQVLISCHNIWSWRLISKAWRTGPQVTGSKGLWPPEPSTHSPVPS